MNKKIRLSRAELLQRLIQFDTTNPPGNESECILFINELLASVGIEATVLARDPRRANLVARLKGEGKVPPILLYGHVDVVTTEGQDWLYPPFEGKIVDGFVWGRGALDMKSGVAMMLSAFIRAKVENIKLPGDVILVILSDEEAGGDYGARFLVEEHSDLFRDVRYAIGEFGGFTLYMGKKSFYPIQVAEKQLCWLKATMRGVGGHGSMPVRGQAMAKLADFLLKIDRHNFPVHVTSVTKTLMETLSASLGGVKGFMLSLITKPPFTDRLISLLGEQGRMFYPLFHNTVSPTILHGSEKVNVIPTEISVELDGRLLPGFKPEDLIKELNQIVGDEVEFEVIRHDPRPEKIDFSLFDTLAGILKEFDPEGVPIPFMISGVTDARFFSRLGIQTYGFTPMQLPQDFNFIRTIHGPNERIPAGAVEFGTEAIYRLLQRIGS